MRAERGIGRVSAASLAALLALLPSAARGRGVFGSYQLQYQRTEQTLRLLNPDGTVRDTHLERGFWQHSLDLNHQAELGRSFLLASNLRLTNVAYSRQPDRSRVPEGSVRLSHPWASVFALYRPSTVTSGLGREGVRGPADTARLATITARSQEAVVTGNLGAPGLPQLTLSWVRRHRDADAIAPEATSLNRNAQVSYARGGLSLHGGLGDLRTDPGNPGLRVSTQRTGNVGGAMQLAPRRWVTANVSYDLADTRSAPAGGRETRALTQSGTVSADLWRRPTMGWNLGYVFRSTESRNGVRTRVQTQDGALLFDYAFSPRARVVTGGGMRTVPRPAGSDLLRYVTAVANAQGPLRAGVTGIASGSHTINWDPVLGAYGVSSARTGLQMRFMPGLDASADISLTATGDTASRDQGSALAVGGRVQAVPLRSLVLRFGTQVSRLGPGFTDPRVRSQASTAEVSWKLVPALQLTGSRGVTTALSANGPRTTTDVATVQYSPGSRFRLSANWSRSTQARSDPTAALLVGHEILGARLLMAVTRTLTFNGGASIADPGEPTRSRQLDAALTLAFGR